MVHVRCLRQQDIFRQIADRKATGHRYFRHTTQRLVNAHLQCDHAQISAIRQSRSLTHGHIPLPAPPIALQRLHRSGNGDKTTVKPKRLSCMRGNVFVSLPLITTTEITGGMSNGTKFQLACIVVLWLLLCYLLVTSQPFTLKVLFMIIASGIIVFVPLYKKHFKKRK